jgi:DUF971 family protein
MRPRAFELLDGALRITWDDGVVCYPGTLLRAACRCATCQAAKRRDAPTFSAAGGLVAAEPVGEYALQLRFADGYDRSIFPFV